MILKAEMKNWKNSSKKFITLFNDLIVKRYKLKITNWNRKQIKVGQKITIILEKTCWFN
jgi:hypothetical protein